MDVSSNATVANIVGEVVINALRNSAVSTVVEGNPAVFAFQTALSVRRVHETMVDDDLSVANTIVEDVSFVNENTVTATIIG